MRFDFLKTCLYRVLLVVVICCCSTQQSYGWDTASELQFEVATLNSWLGTGSKAEGWRKYLGLNVLDTQAAKGNQADLNALKSLLDRFKSDTDGLDHPAFANVRFALKNHLLQLQRSQGLANQSTINASGYNFRPISADTFAAQKAATIYDVQMMKIFMKKSLSSRPRALAYYELKPDKLIAMLDGLEVVQGDNQTEKKLKAEIEALEDRGEVIKERVRTLNEQVNKIAGWMDSIKSPEGVTPPGPDDEKSNATPESNEESSEPQLTAPREVAPQQTPDEIAQLQKKQTIELEQRALNLELEKIENQIESAKEQIEEIREKAKQRRTQIRDDVRELQSSLAAFEGLQTKYRDIYFTAARDSLTRLTRSYFYANSSGIDEQLAEKTESLSEDFSKLSDPQQRRSAAEVGTTLAWMELAGQSSEIITAIRRQHSLPNLEIDVAGSLLQQAVSREIAQNERVDDLVLGRLIRGFATSNGNVKLHLMDDPNQIHASVQLQGSINSDTYSRSGPFTAYAGATGQYEARRSFFANVGGFFAGDVYGAANINSYFKSIDSNMRLVKKIALKTYAKTKLRSEAISSKRLEDRIVDQFSDETDGAAKDGKKQFKKLTKRQASEASVLPSLYLYSSNNKIHVVGKKSTLFDLAAPIAPVRSSYLQSDISVRLHETMLSNFVSPLFASRTFSNEQITEKLSEFVSDLKQPESEATKDESFSISFDPSRPIQFEFDDNLVAVTISGRRFKQGKNSITGSLQIRIQFKLIRGSDNVIRFKQFGDVAVDFGDPDRKNAKLVAFRSFLEDRLNEVIGQNEAISLELPNNLIPVDKIDALKDVDLVKRLKLNQLRMKDGWLYVGWNSGRYAAPVDLSGIWQENFVQRSEAYDANDIPDEVNAPVDLNAPPAPSQQ